MERSEAQLFSEYIQLLKDLNAASQNKDNRFEAIFAEYKKRANSKLTVAPAATIKIL